MSEEMITKEKAQSLAIKTIFKMYNELDKLKAKHAEEVAPLHAKIEEQAAKIRELEKLTDTLFGNGCGVCKCCAYEPTDGEPCSHSCREGMTLYLLSDRPTR